MRSALRMNLAAGRRTKPCDRRGLALPYPPACKIAGMSATRDPLPYERLTEALASAAPS
jgi:hypothetical protein